MAETPEPIQDGGEPDADPSPPGRPRRRIRVPGRRRRRSGSVHPDRQIRYGRRLALLFCLAGFAVIGVGWSGMARTTCVDCQLPYLLSGGAVGLGLIMVGVGILVTAQIRAAALEVKEALDAREAPIPAPAPPPAPAADGNGAVRAEGSERPAMATSSTAFGGG